MQKDFFFSIERHGKKLNKGIQGIRNIYCVRLFNRKGLYYIITFFAIGETMYVSYFFSLVFFIQQAVIQFLKFGRY